MNDRVIRAAALSLAVAWLVALVVPARAAGAAASTTSTREAAFKPKRPKPRPFAALTDGRVLELAKASGLTSDIVRNGVEYILKYRPILARDLDNMLRGDPRQFKNIVSSHALLARDLEQLRKSAPAHYARRDRLLSFDAQAERLADRYKAATEAEKPQVEAELANVLGKAFELRLEEERYQLELARKKCDEMQARINERAKNRDRIVDRQVITLLGLSDLLNW
jgi:hypothetical protein